MERLDLLFRLLRVRGVARAADIQSALGISQPVVSRLIHEAGDGVCRLGRGRATRYSLPREIAGVGRQTPLHRVDEDGHVHPAGVLHFLEDGKHWLEREEGPGELFSGLPPFLEDMRPQGYLGRGFPMRHPDLQLPARITDWSDDHRLIAVARRGEDCVGNLILGEESLDRFLARPVQSSSRRNYPALARESLTSQAGSSAGGEHPKFAAYCKKRQVLVKFAGGDGNAADRWRDLLVCEHLALEQLREVGIPVARAEWFDLGGFRFLEVERFDRVGTRGRRGVISLFAVNSYYLGYASESWSKAARQIQEEPSVRIEEGHADRLIWLDTFGELIANTDRHYGNISFFAEETPKQTLALTPVYDMLPMAFAPQGAQVPEVTFTPRPRKAINLHVWDDAADQALQYWDRLCGEASLSAGFRKICSDCREAVARAVSDR